MNLLQGRGYWAVKTCLPGTYGPFARRASAADFESRVVDARHADSVCKKVLHFVRQIRVNHKSITSHAPRAATRCEMRMSAQRKSLIPSFGTVQGPFQITSLEFAGEHNGEVTYDMALASAGELTFAADT